MDVPNAKPDGSLLKKLAVLGAYALLVISLMGSAVSFNDSRYVPKDEFARIEQRLDDMDKRLERIEADQRTLLNTVRWSLPGGER